MMLSEIENYFDVVEKPIKCGDSVYIIIEYHLRSDFELQVGDGYYNRFEYLEDGFVDLFPEDVCDGVITLESIDSELPEWATLSRLVKHTVLEG